MFSDMKLFTLLLLIINSVNCLKYFEIIQNKYTSDVDTSFPSGSFIETRKTCMENDCKAFYCETENVCFIISDNWNGNLISKSGSNIYSAMKTCKDGPCSQDTGCQTLPYVKPDTKEQYTCCSKYTCGSDCDTNNFVSYKDLDLSGNSIDETNFYVGSAGSSTLQTDCLDYCVSDEACGSVLLHWSESSGHWICDKKITSHRYVNLIANPTNSNKKNLIYFYRTRMCEADFANCNGLRCDTEEVCVDGKTCCPKFKCGSNCSTDNFQLFAHKDLPANVIGTQIQMTEKLVVDCKQYCVSDPGCKSFLLFYYISWSRWICQKKAVTHFEVSLVDYPDDSRATDMSYFYRKKVCE